MPVTSTKMPFVSDTFFDRLNITGTVNSIAADTKKKYFFYLCIYIIYEIPRKIKFCWFMEGSGGIEPPRAGPQPAGLPLSLTTHIKAQVRI